MTFQADIEHRSRTATHRPAKGGRVWVLIALGFAVGYGAAQLPHDGPRAEPHSITVGPQAPLEDWHGNVRRSLPSER